MVRILLLGTTELLSADAAPVHIGGSRRRAVLAALAVHLNHPMTVGRLAGIVWDGAPPREARAALQGHVSALRRLLPAGLTLETHGPSYRLAGAPELVDCHRFDGLAARAAADETRAPHLFDQALRLWRGPAFADLATSEFFAACAERLHEARLHALEAWAALEIRQGTGGRLTPLLLTAAQEDPLRETLVSALMRCLYQEDRQSEAIEVYHRTSDRLAAELGVRPGPELRAAFARVLQASPGSVPGPVPRRLPGRPAAFVGRADQCAWLDQIRTGTTASPLAVVTGPAGVGKTALVLQWAHTAAERFPDGRLFADLHGFDGEGPEDPALPLARFLRALGVPEADIPGPTGERAALFRALTRTRRMLIVLDDAPDAGTVRRLLPDGGRCMTVVTSRNAMLDLAVTEGGALQALPALSPDEALALLEESAGRERARAEPGAATRLAALCDHLPLALRLCADRLAARPDRPLADLAGELEDERTRLDRIGAGLTSALDLTCSRLPATARALVPLLGLHPGADVDAYAAAALLGSSLPRAREALSTLAAWHLGTEPRPGRLGRPDLVVLYCRRQAETLPEEESAAASLRLLEYHLEATARAALTFPFGGGLVSRPARPPAGGAPAPPDRAAALAWFRRAEPVVRALVLAGLDAGRYEETWRLSENVQTLYHRVPGLTRWPEVAAAAYEAARAGGDPAAEARALAGLGTALAERGRPQEAVAQLTDAVAMAERAGDPLLVANGRLRLGLALLRLGTAPGRAYEAFTRLLPAAEAAGEPEMLTLLHHHAGRALHDAGDPRGALAQVDAALGHADGLLPDSRAFPLFTRAQVLRTLRRGAEAAESARAALAAASGRPDLEPGCRELLTAILRDLGETAESGQPAAARTPTAVAE
jgi:DNA-binding SARP family transcriptional activator